MLAGDSDKWPETKGMNHSLNNVILQFIQFKCCLFYKKMTHKKNPIEVRYGYLGTGLVIWLGLSVGEGVRDGSTV